MFAARNVYSLMSTPILSMKGGVKNGALAVTLGSATGWDCTEVVLSKITLSLTNWHCVSN